MTSGRASLRSTSCGPSAVTTIDTVREIMVMGDDTRLRPTYILNRGVYDDHGNPRRASASPKIYWPGQPTRNGPASAWQTGYWTSVNPLTSRVAVNQMWYLRLRPWPRRDG